MNTIPYLTSGRARSRRFPFPFPLVLALGLGSIPIACTGGGSLERSFEVVSIDLVDGSVWRINRPIRIEFSAPVDFSSVNLNSINVRRVGGAPSAGEFRLEGPSSVLFQPRCPTRDDLADAGFQPGGVAYELNLLGAGKQAPMVVRSQDGIGLDRSVTRRFSTPQTLDPALLYVDTLNGPPGAVLRSASPGDTTRAASYVELGGDDARRHYLERRSDGSVVLDPPLALPLNEWSDPSTRVALVIQIDQSVDPSSSNIHPARVLLEFEDTAGHWRPLVAQVRLTSNCTTAGATLRLEPLGLLPPAARLRSRITREFRDLVGQQSLFEQVDFAPLVTEARPVDLVDELLEEFVDSAFEDTQAASSEPRALWRDDFLAAGFSFEGRGGPEGTFDFLVPAGQVQILNTSLTTIRGGEDFDPTTEQTVVGGLLDVRRLWVQAGATLKLEGPNPARILATGDVTIDGRILLDGTDAQSIVTRNTTFQPQLGAPGQLGGGRGGTGSPSSTSSSVRGGDGFGAWGQAGLGGRGGETGWSASGSLARRRGAGGGGGRLGQDVLNPTTAPGQWDQSEIGLDAEAGFDGGADNGSVSGSAGSIGGAPGPSPFLDPLQDNDFFGTMFDEVGQRVVLGELTRPWAGAGGGGGGDASQTSSFPGLWNPSGDEKGAPGGGGSGALHMLVLGRMAFGSDGAILARGGRGGTGENVAGFDHVGAGSGGGSGGHVVIECAGQIDLSRALGKALIATGGQGGAGPNDVGGSFQGPNGPRGSLPRTDACPPGYPTGIQTNACLGPITGAGGDGGPGLIQLHTSRGDVGFAGSGAGVLVPNGGSLATVCSPPPLCVGGRGSGCQLIPTFGAVSRARSLWIALGEGGFDGAQPTPRDVIFELGGTDPLTGEVLTDGQGGVALKAHVLGPGVLRTAPGLPRLGADGSSVIVDATPWLGSPNEAWLDGPHLLRRFLIELTLVSDPAVLARFDVVAAGWNPGAGELTLHADGSGPPLAEFGGGAPVQVGLRPAFFRVVSDGAPDRLPPQAAVRLLLEATGADANGLPDPAQSTGPLSDVSLLNAPPNGHLRFLRFEVLFDVDRFGQGLDPSRPLPALDFLRLPFRYR